MAVYHLQQQVRSLERFASDFHAAVSLFQFCNTMPLAITGSWRLIAARDAVVTAFNFNRTLIGLSSALKGCASIKEIVDHGALRQARGTMRASFPNLDNTRHMVAHAGELNTTTDTTSRNAIREGLEIPGVISMGPESEISISNSLNGNTYFGSFNGQLVELAISHDSLGILRRVLSLVHGAFDKAIPKDTP